MAKSKKSKVFFFANDINHKPRNASRLKLFIDLIFRREGKKLASINYIFCSDKYILKINKNYLKHNFYTDVITFDLSEKSGPINADVFISIDRVMNNAHRFKTTFKSEIHRVIFHGVLHLCGYRDKTDKEILEIRRKENLYLKMYLG